MSTHATQLTVSNEGAHAPGQTNARQPARIQRNPPAPLPFRSMSIASADAHNRDAELFYLQKQIQAQTQMVIVLEDGERVEGCIEWYDRNALKVRGRTRTMIYKSAIKYMYKLGEAGT
jgi:sRNA-binding regulator protein Hfq